MIELRSATGHITIDPSVGNIPALTFNWRGRTLTPLHRAAWVEEPDALADESIPLVDRKLSGDFVCAPFARSDVEPAPPHGWTANSSWSVAERGDAEASLQLDRRVMGAVITKTIRLIDNAPLLVQSHTIEGGSGGLTFAHHPMIDVAGGARFACSPKRAVLTPDLPIVEGRHAFALGARSEDVRSVPGQNGDPIDLHHVPIADGTEDFVTLVEAEGSTLGWSAVTRHAENDIIFVLKDPEMLPVTMLWHSNGAREDFPWNGRNRGVLGVEDGRAAGAAGHTDALRDNPVQAEGVPTSFALSAQTTHTIRHVIGAVPRPAGWNTVMDIALEGEVLTIAGDSEDRVELPFDPSNLF
ncbi:MAG: hypothetical protein AAGH43_13865 [Pseudomonadota bacterium]